MTEGTRDWTGNNRTAFAIIGASNHSEGERQEHDFYATEPKALELLLEYEQFDKNVWECACGLGHLSEVLKTYGYNVFSTDLISRGYEDMQVNFLECVNQFHGDIITNPPYKLAQQFVEKAMELVPEGHKVCMFLKLTFLESKARRSLFEKYPPKVIYVSSSRLQCAKNGEFDKYAKGTGTAIAYAWYIWEKGYTGAPIIKWFN